MAHVMLDLETWGTKPGSAIRSIGAVVFNPKTGKLGAEFYANIIDASCEDVGLTKDASTVKWWSEQSAEARDALAESQQMLCDVLGEFSRWWDFVGGKQVWGHGASFDPVLLEAAYEASMIADAPWKFWDIRCCRTVLALAPEETAAPKGYVKHNALDDAKAQALRVAAVFKTGRIVVEG